MSVTQGVPVPVVSEKSKLKRELTLLPLFGLIYFTVCGGAFGAGMTVTQAAGRADGRDFGVLQIDAVGVGQTMRMTQFAA